MQFLTQIPVDIISVVQALILLFVAADEIIRYIYRIRAPEGRSNHDSRMGRLSHDHTSTAACSTRRPVCGRASAMRAATSSIAIIIGALLFITVMVGRKENTIQDIMASFIATTITVATPLTLGALSGMYCERSGVVNIAIEGMMLGAAFFGFIGASLVQAARACRIKPRCGSACWSPY